VEALGEAERLYRQGLSMHPACGRATRYSIYLLYSYKSTNTDARKSRPAIWLPSSTSRSLSSHTPLYASSCSGMCVLTLRYLGVLILSLFSYSGICVLILQSVYVSSYSGVCVLILRYMCPHTPVYVSSFSGICVLILWYMCPHTPVYVSSYYYIGVLMRRCMCPDTSTYV
jgi:hypothetical protein